MIVFLKILIIAVVMLLLFYPILPWKAKHKRFSTVSALKYEKPLNRKNGFFVFVVLLEIVLFILVYNYIKGLGEKIKDIPLIGNFIAGGINNLSSGVDYAAFAIVAVIANVIAIYLYVILKAIVKKFIDGFVYSEEDVVKRKKRKEKLKKDKKNKNNDENSDENSDSDDEDEDEDERDEKLGRSLMPEDKEKDNKKSSISENVPIFERIRKKAADKLRTKKQDNDKETDKDNASETDGEINVQPAESAYGAGVIAKLFYEAPDYVYAKMWVRRIASILQIFVYLVQFIYFVLFALMISGLFFGSEGLKDILVNTIKIDKWYVYPFLSLLFIQEICNTFKTEAKDAIVLEKEKDLTDDEKREENKIAIRALASELKRYFDEDHKLRFYPGIEAKGGKFEYKFTNKLYAGALEYIRKRFEDKTGNRGQSYLQFMDAMFNEEHVYFCASFYSEIGEYLIAYTYMRLLSGSRLIFIVKDPAKRDAVRRYILNRLVEMTGGGKDVTWRVYTGEDRLDQADILVASPEDFKDDNLVENCPDFFEETCNAVFIDSDKVVSLESYLCPVIALRLMNASGNRIRFVFLTQDLIRGFAASSLPKLFCLDKVLSFSSADDNERVEYTLWNKESLKNRIYYKNGQKLMSLEGIIAEKAYKYGIDGIRVVTDSPIDHGERKVLAEHGVEINEFYKDVPDINYMIYTDERCNLAAAIYSCTRFKGKRNSVVQIISKPYLLREYFMAKATKENFIKRSSFIQPRITEHAEKEKLSLLKVFCRASTSEGMRVNEFMGEMKNVISLSRVRGDVPLCKFCAQKKFDDLNKVGLKDFAAYLIAALCDSPETYIKDSIANKAKDYYLVVDQVNRGLYSLSKEKFISFRKVREVFDKVFACNERVILRLNDANIGYLDTFPTRVPLEYMVGQSMVYNNVEYEIEQISDDNKIIFLRRENVTFKNCLDTVFLRRYRLGETQKIGQDGVLNNSESLLKEIRVSYQKAEIRGETYGFYNLMSNNQSLNFVRGVEGNPHLEKEAVEKNARKLKDGRLLRVTLATGMKCTDGMRLLCSAVFNEFIKTIFPKAYRCVAICPILLEPFAFDEENEAQTAIDKIKTIYPYILNGSEGFTETDPNRMQFLFINDCAEDIGVFDWFYDKLASNMQEFIINAYSYLYWLKVRPDLNHFIYFGMDKLPECFDLDGVCELFASYNIIISDSGEKNYETAADYEDEEQRRCSFCHKLMESGRYMYFDEEHTKFMCADCMDNVVDEDRLQEIYDEAKKYFETNYPEISFGHTKIKFAKEYENADNFNEWNFRIDPDKRKIVVVYALPERDTKLAVILGMISMWQYDNDLMNEYSSAQLSYEQLKFLRSLGNMDETAAWVEEHLDPVRRNNIEELSARIKSHENDGENTEETEEKEKFADDDIGYTSFSFMKEINEELRELEEEVDYEDIEGEEYSDGLYDPNKTPRFWKRYLKNNALDETEEGEEEKVEEDAETIEDEAAVTEDVDAEDTDTDAEDTDAENSDAEDTDVEDGDADPLDDETEE